VTVDAAGVAAESEGMDNTEIAHLVRSGAPEAFDALLERFGTEVQGVAYLILRDRFDAEDVMSETRSARLSR
jgi:DNA-directed RNA polymerase specialized sigma24 family protein